MAYSTIAESGAETWTFEITDSYPLDACQNAKSQVAEDEDVNYRDLRARVVKAPFQDFVVVVKIR